MKQEKKTNFNVINSERTVFNVQLFLFTLQVGSSIEKIESKQPVVIAIGSRGNIVQTFFVVENLVVETPSLLSAVDKVFKVHFIYSLEYNSKVAHVWQLIQKVVYNIEDGTNTYAGVHDFMSFLKRKKPLVSR